MIAVDLFVSEIEGVLTKEKLLKALQDVPNDAQIVVDVPSIGEYIERNFDGGAYRPREISNCLKCSKVHIIL